MLHSKVNWAVMSREFCLLVSRLFKKKWGETNRFVRKIWGNPGIFFLSHSNYFGFFQHIWNRGYNIQYMAISMWTTAQSTWLPSHSKNMGIQPVIFPQDFLTSPSFNKNSTSENISVYPQGVGRSNSWLCAWVDMFKQKRNLIKLLSKNWKYFRNTILYFNINKCFS